jgi:antitoxin component YwqK of YwqJK toxin-antitoxin module
MNKVFLLIVAVSLFACNPGKKKMSVALIAKPVPAKYIRATDPLFGNRQDTVLYKNEKFSGIKYMLYPNGDSMFVTPYLNGLEEGYSKKWYPNKQLSEERLYINGKKEGIHKGWWEDGKPKFIFAISNDAYTGEFKEWNSNGLLVKVFHYKNGQEEGRQQLYFDDGTVKSNYIIIEGRRYGLLGTKNCINVSDSIFIDR